MAIVHNKKAKGNSLLIQKIDQSFTLCLINDAFQKTKITKGCIFPNFGRNHINHFVNMNINSPSKSFVLCKTFAKACTLY